MRRPVVSSLAVALLVSSGCREYLVDPTPPDPEMDNEFHVGGRIEISDYVIAPEGEIVLAAVRVDLNGDMPEIGDPWRQVHVEDGQFELVLPRRPAFAEMYRPDGEGGSFRIASYMLGAYVDINENRVPDREDILVAASTELIVFADGEHMQGTEGMELPAGWNAVEWRIDGEEHDVDELGWSGHLMGMEIPANLLPYTREAGLGGQIESAMGRVRVDLYALTEQYTGENPPHPSLSSVAVDASAPGATFRFPGPMAPPPAEHLFGNGDGLGARIGVAMAVAYDDVDGNGAYDPAVDVRKGTSLDADQARLLIYVKPKDFTAAFYEQVYGLASGWMLADARGDDAAKVDWKLGILVDQER